MMKFAFGGRTAVLLSLSLVTVGCESVLGIRPPIPTIVQGNIYTPQDLEKLTVGMSDSQALYVLGTPLMRPIYAPNDWYYYSSAVRERETTLRRLLVLNFEDGKLVGWEERLKNVDFIEDIRLQELERGIDPDAVDALDALDDNDTDETEQTTPPQ